MNNANNNLAEKTVLSPRSEALAANSKKNKQLNAPEKENEKLKASVETVHVYLDSYIYYSFYLFWFVL